MSLTACVFFNFMLIKVSCHLYFFVCSARKIALSLSLGFVFNYTIALPPNTTNTPNYQFSIKLYLLNFKLSSLYSILFPKKIVRICYRREHPICQINLIWVIRLYNFVWMQACDVLSMDFANCIVIHYFMHRYSFPATFRPQDVIQCTE